MPPFLSHCSVLLVLVSSSLSLLVISSSSSASSSSFSFSPHISFPRPCHLLSLSSSFDTLAILCVEKALPRGRAEFSSLTPRTSLCIGPILARRCAAEQDLFYLIVVYFLPIFSLFDCCICCLCPFLAFVPTPFSPLRQRHPCIRMLLCRQERSTRYKADQGGWLKKDKPRRLADCR